MKYTHVIWDFNGTILDDVAVGIESVNALLKARGIKTIDSVEYYRSVFCFPIVKYYEKIGFDFSKEKFSDVAVEWVERYMSGVAKAPLNANAEVMLENVKKNGLKNILISATELNMLKKQLDMLGISNLFDEVYGLDNIHAQNKIGIALEWKKQNGNAKALLVGDTDHDLETSRAVGADCILYAGGHQSMEYLSKFGCPVITDLFEVESFLN